MSETTNSRAVWWSLVQIVVIVSACVWQTKTLRVRSLLFSSLLQPQFTDPPTLPPPCASEILLGKAPSLAVRSSLQLQGFSTVPTFPGHPLPITIPSASFISTLIVARIKSRAENRLRLRLRRVRSYASGDEL